MLANRWTQVLKRTLNFRASHAEKVLMIRNSLFILLFCSIWFSYTKAEVLSYSGRLVNATGVPVSGSPSLRFDLVYSGDTTTILCTKTASVPLSNGVFHANLDFASSDCGGKPLLQILDEIPSGQSLSYQVSDLTNSKSYGFQPVSSVPMTLMAQMAKTLDDLGATDGQVLKWNNTTKKWVPSAATSGSGTLVDLQAGAGITVAPVDADTYSVAITNAGVGTTQLADSSVTSLKIADGTIVDADINNNTISYGKLNLADGSIPSSKVNGLDSGLSGKEPTVTAGTSAQYYRGDKTWQDFNSAARLAISGNSPVTYSSGTGVIDLSTIPISKGGTGLTSATVNSLVRTSNLGLYEFKTCSIGEIIIFQATGPECGVLSTSDSTKLPLAGGTMSGAIAMGGNKITGLDNPATAQDAATKFYVDNIVSGSSLWTLSGSDIFRTSGNVGVGTSTNLTEKIVIPNGSYLGGVKVDGSATRKLIGYNNLNQVSIAGDNSEVVFGTANVGIGTTTPNGKLDVKGSIVMSGATSGYSGFQVPAVAGSTVWTLPAADGTSGQILSTNGSGVLAWTNASSGGISALTGDVTASGSGSVAATIANSAVTYAKMNLADGDIPQAKVNGLVTALSGKEASITAGTSAQYWRGDKTWQTLNTTAVAEGTNLYFTEPRVRSTPLTGYSTGTATSIAASDNFLQAIGKLEAYVISLSSNGQWTAGGGNVYRTSGNVGIGTSSPTSPLDVKSSASSSNPVRIQNAAGNKIWTLWETGGGHGEFHLWKNDGTRAVQIASSNDTFFNGGNVGVGTTTPNGKFDVKGTFVMSGATSGYAGFQVPAVAGSTVWTLPSADGSNGQILSTNGAGVLSWATPSGGGGGDFKADGSVPMTGDLKLKRNLVGGNINNVLDTGTSAGNAFMMRTSDADIHLRTINNNNILFTSNSNERMRINISGNVGINTTTPNGKLDVKGSIVMSGATSGFSGFQVPAVAGSTVWTLPSADGTSGQVLSTDGSGILAWTNASSGGITALTGDVTASGSGSVAATIANNSINSAKIVDGSIVDADIAPNTITYSKLNLADGDIPSAKVNGLATSLSGKEPTITAGTSAQYWRGDKSWQTLNTTVVPEGTNLYFTEPRVRSTLLTGYSTGTAIPITTSDSFLQAIGKLEAHVHSLSSSGQWTSSSGNVYRSSGNVGIGTSNPGAKFHVDGASAFESSAASSSGPTFSFWKSRNYAATQNGDELGFISFYGHSGSALYRSAFILGKGEGTPTATSVPGKLSFYTTPAGASDSSERMTILSNGNVGVGTSSPTSPFHAISSGQRIANFGYSTNGTAGGQVSLQRSRGTDSSPLSVALNDIVGSYRFEGHDGSAYMKSASIQSEVDATPSSGKVPGRLNFLTTDSSGSLTERMRIDSLGNVGIGTTAPTATLHLAKSAANSWNGVQIENSGSGFSSSSLFMKEASSGFVDFSYHNSGATGTSFYDTPSSANIRTGNDASGGLSFLTQHASASIRFGTGGFGLANERMRIDAAGNIGIGTTAPSEKLEVSGNIKASAFISTSDKRLKKNIKLASGLAAILQIRGVTYEWKKDGSMDMGVIAQETENIFPWAVKTDKVTGYKAVNYSSLMAPLIESIRELNTRTLDHGSKIEIQNRKIASLEAETSRLSEELINAKAENEKMKEELTLIKKHLGIDK
jgi:hypothetical protein